MIPANANHGLADHCGVWLRSRGLQQNALGRRIDQSRASQGKCGPGRVGDLRECHVVSRKPVQIRLNLDLPDRAPEDDDVRDPRHCEQARLDDPVRRIPQRVVVDLVRYQPDLQQIHRARHERRQLW